MSESVVISKSGSEAVADAQSKAQVLLDKKPRCFALIALGADDDAEAVIGCTLPELLVLALAFEKALEKALLAMTQEILASSFETKH